MFIADAVYEDCDSNVSTNITNQHMQRGGGYSEMILSGVAPFMERNQDNVASTLEWRWKVLQSQQATRAVTSSSRHQQTAEEHRHASLESEIGRMRQHCHEQEKVLEREIVRLEQRYELDMKLLEKEANDEVNYPVAESWEVQSDYQPTECGDDGSGYPMPERELKQQALGQ
jgi:hypothetical protein